MSISSRWLTWTPSRNRIIEKNSEPEPAKPAKVNFAGFAGSTPATFPMIEAVKPFPRCPACQSYYLYRKNNIVNYECETCGLQDIREEVARRVQLQ